MAFIHRMTMKKLRVLSTISIAISLLIFLRICVINYERQQQQRQQQQRDARPGDVRRSVDSAQQWRNRLNDINVSNERVQNVHESVRSELVPNSVRNEEIIVQRSDRQIWFKPTAKPLKDRAASLRVVNRFGIDVSDELRRRDEASKKQKNLKAQF